MRNDMFAARMILRAISMPLEIGEFNHAGECPGE